MGMYDSVYAKCPSCGGNIGFQSKAGACKLKDYKAESLPPEIAKSLVGDVEICAQCGAFVSLVLDEPIRMVRMKAVIATNPSEDVWRSGCRE